MAYLIKSDELGDTPIKEYKDVRIMEALFRAKQMDYSLTYPEGHTMNVSFNN